MTNQSSRDVPTDVIVIGGGIIGCWTAHYLLDRGCCVTLVERDQIGSGASSGNCGYICPSHVMPLCGPGAISHLLPQLFRRGGALSIPFRFDPTLWKWLLQFARHCTAEHQQHAAMARHALLKSSMSLYREFQSRSPIDCQWEDHGLLVVHRHAATMDAFQVIANRLATEFDIHPVRYDRDELTQFEPSLVDGLAGGWQFPADAHLNPQKLLNGLKERLIQRGVVMEESMDVLRMDVQSGRVIAIETSRGRLRADTYVLTTGAEAPRLARSLGCRLPIVPGKGYSMTFAAMPHPPRVPMIFEDSHVAVTPLGNEFRVGSTMQLTGYDRTLDARRMEMIRDEAQSHFRESIGTEPLTRWAGWRPMVQDDLPLIDRAPSVVNAFVAAGNGMIGLSTGTATGKLIAEMVCDEVPHLDVGPYAINRFDDETIPYAEAYHDRFPSVRAAASSAIRI